MHSVVTHYDDVINGLNLLIKSFKVCHDPSQTFEDFAELRQKSTVWAQFEPDEKILMSVWIKLNWKRLLFVKWAILGITSRFLYIIKDERTVTLKVAIEQIEGLTYNKNVEKEFLIHVKNQDDLHLYKKKRRQIFQAIKHAYFGLN